MSKQKKKTAPPRPAQQDTGPEFANSIRNLNLHAAVKKEAERPAATPVAPPKKMETAEDPAQIFLSGVGGVTPLKAVAKERGVPHNAPPAPSQEESRGTERHLSSRERSRRATQRTMERATTEAAPLSPEDEENLFGSAMRDVDPLHARGRDMQPPVAAKPRPPLQEEDPLRDFMEGKIEFSLEFTEEFIEGHVLGLDPLTVGKLRAGQFSPEAHLDLHGLTAEAARDELLAFFKGAYYRGQRTVLLVPGRGLNSPNGVGVLRSRVQDWLTQDPLKRVVLAFCTARQQDGGAGALYVLLRKFKKSSGKIRWDRIPEA